MSQRVCIIGAGPCGMSTLISFAKMKNMPTVVCYEKQSTWGGQWNFTWKTGLDENGEPVHSSMYKNMWCNGNWEVHEYPDYRFDKHFGKPTPSFPSRVVWRDYLEGIVATLGNLKNYLAEKLTNKCSDATFVIKKNNNKRQGYVLNVFLKPLL